MKKAFLTSKKGVKGVYQPCNTCKKLAKGEDAFGNKFIETKCISGLAENCEKTFSSIHPHGVCITCKESTEYLSHNYLDEHGQGN